VDAIDLRVGDVLLLRSGEQAAITALVVRHARLPVYNFHVEELHCYAVGHAQILVHNNSLGTSEAIAKHLVADHPERFGRDLGRIQRLADKVIASGVTQETKTGAVISHHNGISVIRRPDGTGTMVVDKNGNSYRNWLALEGVK